MKRVLCLLSALLLCLSLAVPGLAAEDPFVPSIGYKDGPDILEVIGDGEGLGGCLIVTSIRQAKEKLTDITQEERDLLLEVYVKLAGGEMRLPLETDYVIRELVDVSWAKSACRDVPHGHKEWLDMEDTFVHVKFDLGVAPDEEIIVMTYIDEKWEPIEKVTNNGDGTLTCEFENICPVVFCVPRDREPAPGAPAFPWLWVSLILLAMLCIGVGVYHRRKHRR